MHCVDLSSAGVSMSSINRKRIVRNTIMLYLRMILAMGVGLYTSRVLLAALGVEDFGIYHLLVGFIVLLGFMQGAMTSATQRYFAFDIGENRGSNMLSLFNTSMQIHMLLGVGIALFAGTIGHWFLVSIFSVATDRLEAAIWTYHIAVVTFVVTLMTVPLIAMLIANERMGLFAVLSIVDVLLKLAAVLFLQIVARDKLVAYALMLLLVAAITFCNYLIVNISLFPAARIMRIWNAKSFRSMFGFIGWSAWGYLAAAMSSQGNNILLNVFFGPVVNAGRAVSQQANGAITNLVQNMQAAINPQIIKQYASGNIQLMKSLVQNGARYNFLLLLLLALPVFFNVDALLEAWLVVVPPYASAFLKLTIIASMIDSLSLPLITAAQATGRIRLYQCVVGGLLLLNVPLSYIGLRFWDSPVVVVWSTIILAVIALMARILMLKKLIDFSIEEYALAVLTPIVFVATLATTAVYFAAIFLADMNFVLSMVCYFTIALLVVALVGLSRKERMYLFSMILRIYKKASH